MFSQSISVKNLKITFLAALLLTVALVLGACQDTGTGGEDTGTGNERGVMETPQGDDIGGAGPNAEDAEPGFTLETPEADLTDDSGSEGEAGNMDETGNMNEPGQEDMSGEAGDAGAADGAEGEATPGSQ